MRIPKNRRRAVSRKAIRGLPKRKPKFYMVGGYKLDKKNFDRYLDYLEEKLRTTIASNLKRNKGYDKKIQEIVNRIIKIQNLPEKKFYKLYLKHLAGNKSLGAKLWNVANIWMNTRLLSFLQSRSRF